MVKKEIKKPTVSWSKVSSFMRCAEAYRRRYICNDIIPPGIALIRGSSVHVGAETNFAQKIKSHKDLSAKKIVNASVASFEGRIKQEGLLLTKEEESIGKRKIVGAAKDQVVILANLFSGKVAPKYQPRIVEEKITIPVKSSSHDLVAKMDLVTVKDEIPDLKTSGKMPNQRVADNSDQFTMYSLAFEAKYRRPPKALIMECLVASKIPKAEALKTRRTRADYGAMIERVNMYLKAIKAGVFMPCARDSWCCCQKYCGFYPTCPYVTKGG